jgi:hypothetical protein
MCSYTHNKNRNKKRILQKVYAQTAKRLVDERVNAIVLAGLALENQTSLYDGVCISFETNKKTFAKQKRVLTENSKLFQRMRVINRTMKSGLRYLVRNKVPPMFSVLDRDFTTALFTPKTTKARQQKLREDISEFLKIAKKYSVVTLTYCLDQRAFGHKKFGVELPEDKEEYIAETTAKLIHEVMSEFKAAPVWNETVEYGVRPSYLVNDGQLLQYHTYRDTKSVMFMQQWMLEK